MMNSRGRKWMTGTIPPHGYRYSIHETRHEPNACIFGSNTRELMIVHVAFTVTVLQKGVHAQCMYHIVGALTAPVLLACIPVSLVFVPGPRIGSCPSESVLSHAAANATELMPCSHRTAFSAHIHQCRLQASSASDSRHPGNPSSRPIPQLEAVSRAHHDSAISQLHCDRCDSVESEDALTSRLSAHTQSVGFRWHACLHWLRRR